jgi:hypothetical protein
MIIVHLKKKLTVQLNMYTEIKTERKCHDINV